MGSRCPGRRKSCSPGRPGAGSDHNRGRRSVILDFGGVTAFLNQNFFPLDAPALLTASRLACQRGQRRLFEGLDLSVPAGRIVWVRGQNGRGKTSLLRLAAGLASPAEGRIERRARPLFIGHANALKDDLTAAEALAFLLRVHALPADADTVLAALDTLGVKGRKSAPVRTLSQGQRRRVALARLAVAGDSPLWILDEPFDALDADGIERLNTLLLAHVRQGGSVLLSSHLPLDTARLPVTEVDLDGSPPVRH